MRVASVLFLVLLCLTSQARSQVSVDMRALDPAAQAQPPARAAPASPHQKAPDVAAAPRAAARTSHIRRRAVARTAPAAEEPASAARAPSATPSTALMPPAAAVTPPIPPLPTAQPSPPPPVTTQAAPTPSAAPLPRPVRLVFDEGKADLTPEAEAEVMILAHEIPSSEASSVNVIAYAAGKPDDPSTARRLSLSRGMAVRSVLLASGVPSSQIYVRALGATASDGPADRVELVVARLGTVTR